MTPRIHERLWIERKPKGDVYRPHRVRVDALEPARLALVHGKNRRCIPVDKIGGQGEGTILVPVAELVAAAPLSAADEAEYARLDALLAGSRGYNDRLARPFFALLHRSRIYGSVPPAGARPGAPATLGGPR